jgi:hypothetical protein
MVWGIPVRLLGGCEARDLGRRDGVAPGVPVDVHIMQGHASHVGVGGRTAAALHRATLLLGHGSHA